VATSQELILELRAQGFSNAEIGRRLGRDSSLIGQIAKGTKPGANLQQALTELVSGGEVKTPPFRRTSSDGTLVPPAPRGQRIRTVTKSTAQPKTLPKKRPTGQRNLLSHQANRLPNGRELHRVTVPKTDRARNRSAGSKVIADVVARAAAAGRRISGTVWAEVQRKDGTRDRIPVQIGGHGGYSAQSIHDSIQHNPDAAFEWVDGQIQGRYPEFEGGFTVVAFDLDVW
jgi:hypothetical protein